MLSAFNAVCRRCFTAPITPLNKQYTRSIHKSFVSWAANHTFPQFQELLKQHFPIETDLEEKYPDLANHQPYRVAAVTVGFYQKDNDIHVLMIKRASKGLHGGQIAFPGGKKEPYDTSFLDTALRETYEEVGVSPSQHNLQIIGNMKPLLSNAYKFHVVPYVATLFGDAIPSHPSTFTIPTEPQVPPLPIQAHHLEKFPPYTLQPAEIDYILSPSLRELAEGYFYHVPNKEANEKLLADLNLDKCANIEWIDWRGPAFIVNHPRKDILWGLSARILVDLFKAIKPQDVGN